MLRLLNIVNFAVIDRLQVEFKHGLNVLSGETGSGKSILMDALGLLLGDRSSVDFIRTGENRAFIEGVFETEGNRPLEELLADAGVDVSEGEALIRRELVANGRGRIFVNNQVANVGLLKSIQPHLIDIHGQGDQQSLLLPEVHLNLFDAFAGASKNRARVAQAYDNLLGLARELERIRQSESERLRTLDMINFQILEIEQANLTPNEDVELEAERNLLVNAERLAELSGEAYKRIYDDEGSILSSLSVAQKKDQRSGGGGQSLRALHRTVVHGQTCAQRCGLLPGRVLWKHSGLARSAQSGGRPYDGVESPQEKVWRFSVGGAGNPR